MFRSRPAAIGATLARAMMRSLPGSLFTFLTVSFLASSAEFVGKKCGWKWFEPWFTEVLCVFYAVIIGSWIVRRISAGHDRITMGIKFAVSVAILQLSPYFSQFFVPLNTFAIPRKIHQNNSMPSKDHILPTDSAIEPKKETVRKVNKILGKFRNLARASATPIAARLRRHTKDCQHKKHW